MYIANYRIKQYSEISRQILQKEKKQDKRIGRGIKKFHYMTFVKFLKFYLEKILTLAVDTKKWCLTKVWKSDIVNDGLEKVERIKYIIL